MGEGDEAAVKLEGKEDDVVIEFVGGGGNEDVLKGLKAGDKARILSTPVCVKNFSCHFARLGPHIRRPP
jgi:hypothetical protein